MCEPCLACRDYACSCGGLGASCPTLEMACAWLEGCSKVLWAAEALDVPGLEEGLSRALLSSCPRGKEGRGERKGCGSSAGAGLWQHQDLC